MDGTSSISQLLSTLDELCGSGYAIALHIRYTTPTFLFQTYPKDWRQVYTEQGMVLHDPTVRWGFENTGTIHWHSLEADDTFGIFEKARAYGLNYGVVLAIVQDGSRSVASFSNSEREFNEDEVAKIAMILGALHAKTVDVTKLPAEERAELKRLSIDLTHGASPET